MTKRRIKLPQYLNAQMGHVLGFTGTDDFNRFHAEVARYDLMMRSTWVVLRTQLVSDGWCMGTKTTEAIIEVRGTGELKRLIWHTQGSWMEKSVSGGQALYVRALEHTFDTAEIIAAGWDEIVDPGTGKPVRDVDGQVWQPDPFPCDDDFRGYVASGRMAELADAICEIGSLN